MIIEMVGRAMLAENVGEADKLMRQAALLLGEQRRQGEPVHEDELAALGEATAWLARRQKSPAWTDWFAEARDQPG